MRGLVGACCAFLVSFHLSGAANGPGLPTESYTAGELLSSPAARGRLVVWHRGWLYIPGNDSPTTVWNISNPRSPVKVNEVNAGANGHDYIKVGDMFTRDYAMTEWNNAAWGDLNQLPNFVPYSGPAPAPGFNVSGWEPVWYYPYRSLDGFNFNAGANINSAGRIVIGNLLIMYPHNGPDQVGVATWDISNPDSPRLLGVLDPRFKIHQYTTGKHIYKNHLLLIGERDQNDVDGQKPNLVGIDFSDPSNLTISYQIIDWPGRYVQFQDEFGFNFNYKYNFETGQIALQYTEGFGTDFYWMPLGHLLVGAGDDNNFKIFAHQAARDTRAPRVAYHIPRSNEVNCHVKSRIGIVVHETLDDTTVNSANIIVRPVGGSPINCLVSILDDDIINVNPHQALAANTTYEVVVVANGIKDASGNGIEGYTYRFSTGSSIADAEPTMNFSFTPVSPVTVGTTVTFSQSTSGFGAGLQHAWNFGDGTSLAYGSGGASSTRAYTQPGNYLVEARARDNSGNEVTKTQRIMVYQSFSSQPTRSSPILVDETRRRVWVCNPDSDSVTAINADSLAKVAEYAVDAHPLSLALDNQGKIWVVCRDSDTVKILDAANGSVTATIALQYGSAPSAITFNPAGDTGYIAEYGTGRITRVSAASRAVTGGLDVGPTPRSLAITSSGGRLLVPRFISGDSGGQVWSIALPAFSSVTSIALPTDTTTVDDTNQGRGLPNYVASVAIHPSNGSALLAYKKDNIFRGQFRDTKPLTFETTTRAMVGTLNLGNNSETISARLDLDNSSQPSAVCVSKEGNHFFVTEQGNNRVLVRDAFSRVELAKEDTGLAPQGIALDSATRRLFVLDFMDRSVSVFNATTILTTGAGALPKVGTVTDLANEKLSDTVLRGKQIFYNAADTRMSKDGYISCAVCHLDGDHDGRTWDFTDRGEGLRNTVSLRGRKGDLNGPVHWSGNFDEIQDFEHDIRTAFGGSGFLSDSQFNSGTRNQPLGDSKTGISNDLDALAAYVNSLSSAKRSPYRTSAGALTSDAISGQSLFQQLSCATCHTGDSFSDSSTGLRHNVGTIKPSSGNRLGQTLDGFDTPELFGLWNTAPYLHDGSAATVRAVLTTQNAANQHGNLSALTSAQIDQLAAYLLQVEAPLPALGTGTGLAASYFNNVNLTGAPALTRIDSLIDFNWGNAAPGAGVAENDFSVRWSGLVEAPATGNYTFQTESDDGIRVWLNGVQIINNWTEHPPTIDTSASVALTKDVKYSLTVEYYDRGLGAIARLRWTIPGSGSAVPVPQDRLYQSGGSGQSTTSGATTGGATTGGGTTALGTGLSASYYNSSTLPAVGAAAALTRVDGPVDFDWLSNAPGSGVNADNFSVRWTGQVEAPSTGTYTFQTQSDDGIRLSVNGVQIINNWTDHGPTVDNSAAISLTAGTKYSITLEFYEKTGGAVARLRWITPGSGSAVPIPQNRLFPATTAGTGLSASYYNSVTLPTSGTPAALSRVDGPVDFNWGSNSPGTGVNADNFSVRWTGEVEAPATGSFTFQTESDDGIRLWVNGNQVINNWTDHGPTVDNSAAVSLVGGVRYSIALEFYEKTGGATARLRWITPGAGSAVAIPAERLFPGASGTTTGGTTASGLLNGAVYELEPQCAPGSRLDVGGASDTDGAQVQIWTDFSNSNQRWRLEAVGTDWELIPQHATSRRLEVNQSGTSNGTKIQIGLDANTSNQRFRMLDAGGGWFEIHPLHAPGSRLDVNGSGTADGTLVHLWIDNDSSAQRWKLIQQ